MSGALCSFPVTDGAEVVKVYEVRQVGDWFRVFEVGAETVQHAEWTSLLPAVVYCAQLAGFPVKACEWDEVGHSDYWPAGVINGQAVVR